jgi:hypothetical protein
MIEKVKLPKAVCDALDYAMEQNWSYLFLANSRSNGDLYKLSKSHPAFAFNNCNLNEIMRAYVLGYEPELTPEEQIKKLYQYGAHDSWEFEKGYRTAVRDALRIHGIEYDWMKDDAK